MVGQVDEEEDGVEGCAYTDMVIIVEREGKERVEQASIRSIR